MKTLANIALAGALAVGLFGINASALAGEWADAIGAKSSVTGQSQTADHTSDWANAVGVEESVTGLPQTAYRGGYGFLEQALANGFNGRSMDSERRVSEIAAN
jgi:hypothetical protein